MTAWISLPLPTGDDGAGLEGAQAQAAHDRVAQILAGAREARAVADQAEIAILEHALEWARAHIVTDAADAAYAAPAVDDGDGLVLGSEGAPMIAHWCVAPFAASQGLSTVAGQALLGDVIELAYRLPRLWARVRAGEVRTWRARRVAQGTTHLTLQAADYVDRQVAAYVHSLSGPAIERTIHEVEARLMPDFAAERAAQAAEGRHFSIESRQVSFNGTVDVWGELDLADALALEKAVTAGAAHLKALGNRGSLDMRRALAVGELARDQLAFGFSSSDNPAAVRPAGVDGAAAATDQPVAVTSQALKDSGGVFTQVGGAEGHGKASRMPRVPITRQVVLYVHFAADQVPASFSVSGDEAGAGVAHLEAGGGQLVTQEQVAAWCGAAPSRVVVRPVIDLAQETRVTAYEVPADLREQVILRDRTCVFPWCSRNARSCDLDHIVPWDQGGATSSSNLAALCRRHHNTKTHYGWRYWRTGPARYVWQDPHGQTFQVDQAGTTDLGPEPDIDPTNWGVHRRPN